MRDSDGAGRAIAAARTAAETLAQSIDAPDARERFARAAESALPVVRAPTARQAAKQAFGGLTEREREVAVEITRGRSNREIAELLVLSERTIETHVGNILSKLGFTSRAQIAAWGVERGIASADHATT
jgi:DNA-binding NarL/FixJ family response regulator